jgi:hypothetical protein
MAVAYPPTRLLAVQPVSLIQNVLIQDLVLSYMISVDTISGHQIGCYWESVVVGQLVQDENGTP